MPRRHTLRLSTNLSLYSQSEELSLLEKIIRENHFSAHLISLDSDNSNSGYLLLPKEPKYLHQIHSQAPLLFFDFDDTLCPTTQNKKELFESLSALGLSKNTIKFLDQNSRVRHIDDSPSLFYPEIYMRLATLALKYKSYPEKTSLKHLRQNFDELTTPENSFTNNLHQFSIDPEIQRTCTRHLLNPSLYPDTIPTLNHLKNHPRVRQNIFVITQGNPVTQLQKTLPLLANHSIHGLIITKSTKANTLKSLFNNNPFKKLQITHDAHHLVRGEGINVFLHRRPIAIFDDNPDNLTPIRIYASDLDLPISTCLIYSPKSRHSSLDVADDHLVFQRDHQTDLLKIDLEEIILKNYRHAVSIFLTDHFRLELEKLIVSIYPYQIPDLDISQYALSVLQSHQHIDSILEESVEILSPDKTAYDITRTRIVGDYLSMVEESAPKLLHNIY